MLKADLHVHSKYSRQPENWLIKRLGAMECYTEPETVYTLAKQNGMDLVTITDHDTMDGVLRLREKHPEDVFTGVETTAYFPENGCAVHVLVYGLSVEEFNEINRLRRDLYRLCRYLKERGLPHSLAHPAYSENGRLTVESMEKLLLLFDVFEGISGGRGRGANNGWMDVANALTPARVETLCRRYGIEPLDDEPWIKGFTGGSDDHAGIFIGTTCTVADARDAEGFLESVRARKIYADGRHNDYLAFAFEVYKILSDFSRNRGEGPSASVTGQIARLAFAGKPLKWKSSAEILKLRLANRVSPSPLKRFVLETIDHLHRNRGLPVSKKLEFIYGRMAAISDEYLRTLLRSATADLKNGDVVSLVRKTSNSLQGLCLTLPFFTSLRHLHQSRRLLSRLDGRIRGAASRRPGKVLWFADTLGEMNDVSALVRKLGWTAHALGKDLRIAVSPADGESGDNLPPGVMTLPCVFSFRLPDYEPYVLKVPSVLGSLRQAASWEPDEIYLSTPGPVGLFGLLLGRLLMVRTVGIYHTDYSLRSREATGDEPVAAFLERYTTWFYSMMDEIKVPTREYARLLGDRGLPASKISFLKGGVDTKVFFPHNAGKQVLAEHYRVPDGITLLYAGRISRDKAPDLLAEVYSRLVKKRGDINLILAGDGPYAETLRAKLGGSGRIVFTGRLEQEELAALYSGADVFVFPSVTDTFGLVVLEALACGLPAVVSDAGGAREIVEDGISGFVARAGDPDDWEEKIGRIVCMISTSPPAYRAFRERARARALESGGWDRVVEDIFGERPERESAREEITLKT